MKRRTLSRVAAFFVGCLLIAAVVWGFLWLKQKLNPPAAPEIAQNATDDTVVTLPNGPFSLRVTSSQIGGVTYTSFDVYFVNDTTSELIYSCGRRFPASEVVSINWTGAENDILVVLSGNRHELFAYDGSGQWR